MPTATDRASTHRNSRRRLLRTGVRTGVAAVATGVVLRHADALRITGDETESGYRTGRRQAPAGRSLALAATWRKNDDAGSHHAAGLLRPAAAGLLAVAAHLELPGRAHGVVVEGDGRLLVVARRPGDWLLRFDPSGGRPPFWFWSDGDTVFNGHVLASPDGRRIYTTETDRETGAGLIGVRDAATLETIARWPVGGFDPHEIVHGLDGALWVAVGGIEVRAETGRTKHRLQAMASSLLRLDPRTGHETGRWRLADSRLGLRHLAVSRSGRIGIALQAEHDDAGSRDHAPVLAIWEAGQGLRTVPWPVDVDAAAARGYGGSIVALGDDFVVSCPRAGCAWRFRGGADTGSGTAAPALSELAPVAIASAIIDEVCPLAVVAGTRPVLWAGGVGRAQQVAVSGNEDWSIERRLQLDNHWSVAG